MHKKEFAIGMCCAGFVPKRYKLIDYLPWMYIYEFPVQSRKPKQIVSLDTLIYPFDVFVWCYILSSAMAMFVVFLFIQMAWSHASGEKPPNGWIFHGRDMFCIFML